MMSDINRSKLMVASYLEDVLLQQVIGLVHPFSAGLSVVLGQTIVLLIVLL